MRYWAPISLKDFKEKLNACDDAQIHLDSYDRLTPQIEKDLSKVDFDSENIDAEKIKVLQNGMRYLGVFAAGDWECAVYFIIYWDGKNLRGYIPKEGNLWNTDTKRAYGNDHEKDFKNCKKRWPKAFKNVEIEDFEVSDVSNGHDMKAMKQDIMARIQRKT